jgi:recombination protein RecT
MTKKTENTAIQVGKTGGISVKQNEGDALNVFDLGGRVERSIDKMLTDGRLFLPPNYSPQNAIKSAELVIRQTVDRNGTPALLCCTKESIYNALLDMIVQGLNPGKKQCYFIVYGNQLLMQRSYFGTVMVAKRLAGITQCGANVVYFDDEFEYEMIIDGGFKILKHNQKIENIHPEKIKAAYAVLRFNDGKEYTEIMTISQIKKAWGKGAARGNSLAHQEFPDQMAQKTVINRACKLFIASSDDSDLITDSFFRTTENEYEDNGTKAGALPERTETGAKMDALLFGAPDALPASSAATVETGLKSDSKSEKDPVPKEGENTHAEPKPPEEGTRAEFPPEEIPDEELPDFLKPSIKNKQIAIGETGE